MEKRQHAQRLYMDGGKTQKEIADIVGVSERTLHSWIHQYSWHKLRLATLQAPITIADNLCSQIVELQNAIAAREPGKRYPTMEEAEITRKLIVALERVKKYPSLSMSMQVLETFRHYMRPINKEFATDLGRYADRFLTAESVNGFAPYEVEYGASPASPFYSEPDKEDEDRQCKSRADCQHRKDCSYPSCKKPDLAPPDIRYAVPDSCYPSSAEASAKEGSPAETGSISAIPQPENTENEVLNTPSQHTSFPSGESLPAGRQGRDGAVETGGNSATFQPEAVEKYNSLNRQEIKKEALDFIRRYRPELLRSGSATENNNRPDDTDI